MKVNSTAIGAFVIGAIALILGAVMLFGTGQFFNARIVVLTVFEGSVTGLQVGSPVEFRGVPVGTVKNIKALYDPKKTSFVIPVYMSLDEDSVTNIQEDGAESPPKQEIEKMIAHGLRAQLDIRSLVTGQKFVALEFHPETPATTVGIDSNFPEIPSIASRLQRVTSMFDKLDVDEMAAKAVQTLDGISALVNSPVLASTLENLDNTARNANELVLQLRADTSRISQTATETLEQAKQTMTDARLEEVSDRLDKTLAAIESLAANIDRKVAPLSQSAITTMNQATSTLRTAESLIGEDSNTRYNLDATLEELAAAARSVRLMADYLEQNPDALLKGKTQ